MFNKVIIAGRLTKNPTITFTPTGTGVARLRIAANTKRKENDETLFINAVAFGKTAEAIAKNLGKGSPVLVEGRLRERRFTDELGINRTTFEIVASRIKFLPSNNKPKSMDFDDTFDTELDPF